MREDEMYIQSISPTNAERDSQTYACSERAERSTHGTSAGFARPAARTKRGPQGCESHNSRHIACPAWRQSVSTRYMRARWSDTHLPLAP